jgi:Rod binding domain-containing protein
MISPLGATSRSGGSTTTSLLSRLDKTSDLNSPPKTDNLEVREKFQDFAAGTFYKEMLKALREGQKNSKYFYGGQAEEIFRGQMDQQVAEDLARQHGASFAGPLFDAYSKQTQSGPAPVSPSQVSLSEQAHAFDAVA